MIALDNKIKKTINGIIHNTSNPNEKPAGKKANIDADNPLVGNIKTAIPIKIIDIKANKNNDLIILNMFIGLFNILKDKNKSY